MTRPRRWNEAIRLADLRAQSPSLAISLWRTVRANDAKPTAFQGRCERVASFEPLTFNHTRCFAGQSPLPKRDTRRRRTKPYFDVYGVHRIAEHRTFGPVLMRVTMSKRHIAYVKTAYSPCQFGIGRMSRFNFISHRANKEGRLSVVTPLVPSLFKSLASRAEVTSF